LEWRRDSAALDWSGEGVSVVLAGVKEIHLSVDWSGGGVSAVLDWRGKETMQLMI
jgi:hypothetical protein